MNYNSIKNLDISNGLGVRVSIFFTGCHFHCKNCFNSKLWDFNSGKNFDLKAKNLLFNYLSNEHIKGLSILGGEPLDQGVELLNLIQEIKNKFPNKNIWLWTGYKILNNKLTTIQKAIISYCDFIVDGQFEESLKNPRLLFRGSSNQIIYENDKKGRLKISELNNKLI